jgi:hypothetical protein
MTSEVIIEFDFRICRANFLKLHKAVEICNSESVRTVLNENMSISMHSENCENTTIVLIDLIEVLIN